MIGPSDPNTDEILTAAQTGRFLLENEFLISSRSREHTPSLIVKAVWHGFLPMYETSQGLVLLKLHQSRCLLTPKAIHIGRKVKRRADNFRLSVNEAFSEVVKNVQEHTWTEAKGDCWLADEFAEMYTLVNKLPASARRGISFLSVELWHRESGRLVAGEIGYTVGKIYSSCTGFALKEEFSGAGTFQLAALGRLLVKCGFECWDLGMELKYKKELGGEMHPRASWIATVQRLREEAVELTSPEAATSTRGLFDMPIEGGLLAQSALGSQLGKPREMATDRKHIDTEQPLKNIDGWPGSHNTASAAKAADEDKATACKCNVT